MKIYFTILFLFILGCSELEYTFDDTDNISARNKISEKQFCKYN